MEHSVQHYLLGLFAVANNIPALAPFLALSQGQSRGQSLRLILIGTGGAFLVMTTSMLAGMAILEFFGISISAFQIAGGILLGGTGLSMLNAKGAGDVNGKQVEHPHIERSTLISTMIVPVTIPLTTGAGTMSMVTVFAQEAATAQAHLHLFPNLPLFLAICVMTVVIFLTFYFAMALMKYLGEVGMSVLIKIMGLFTLAIGIQFIITALTRVYGQLPGH